MTPCVDPPGTPLKDPAHTVLPFAVSIVSAAAPRTWTLISHEPQTRLITSSAEMMNISSKPTSQIVGPPTPARRKPATTRSRLSCDSIRQSATESSEASAARRALHASRSFCSAGARPQPLPATRATRRRVNAPDRARNEGWRSGKAVRRMPATDRSNSTPSKFLASTQIFGVDEPWACDGLPQSKPSSLGCSVSPTESSRVEWRTGRRIHSRSRWSCGGALA